MQPLIETRPDSIARSASRREQSPYCVKNLLMRIVDGPEESDEVEVAGRGFGEEAAVERPGDDGAADGGFRGAEVIGDLAPDESAATKAAMRAGGTGAGQPDAAHRRVESGGCPWALDWHVAVLRECAR